MLTCPLRPGDFDLSLAPAEIACSGVKPVQSGGSIARIYREGGGDDRCDDGTDFRLF